MLYHNKFNLDNLNNNYNIDINNILDNKFNLDNINYCCPNNLVDT